MHVGGVELQLHSFIWAVYEGELSASRPRLLYPRGRIPVLIDQESGWVSDADWTISGRENPVVPTGVPNLDCPTHRTVAVPTTV
jgi:hypothetical protein